MANHDEAAARRRRAREALMLARFVPGLEQRYDHFALSAGDFVAYAGVTVAEILAGLGPGWTTRDVEVPSLHPQSDTVPDEEPTSPIPMEKETWFIREIGWRRAIDQIMDRLPEELRHATIGSGEAHAAHRAAHLARLHPSEPLEKLR